MKKFMLVFALSFVLAGCGEALDNIIGNGGHESDPQAKACPAFALMPFITVNTPYVLPAKIRITSSYGITHDNCLASDFSNIDVSSKQSFIHLDAPRSLDEISFTIEDLGDCSTNADDKVLGSYPNKHIHWENYSSIEYGCTYETHTATIFL